ncbi:hypothetical protein [Nocardia sp. alder85J]|uniref:hypothetical protein n=1 Tax=Nocardia sp. alder85J TaxID=2862949 RepID=UPI001CD213DF|nr:hypothetical protein [Nocardia sp. alder85J]MCX4093933.1 hypothetical protein [Nocardia sp. alder85J]
MFGSQTTKVQWRPEAGRLVTLMAVAFGLTVVITRLYLMASGYPKIGGGTYHIAHALFGGLLLVIACLLLLLSSGRTSMIWAAMLAGVGLGLFIDEVGKFITANNNYFFPLAAPIIYLAFLLVVAVARYTARRRGQSPELVLAAVIAEIGQSIGDEITTARRDLLRGELADIDPARCGPQQRELAKALTTYLDEVPCDTETPVTHRVAAFGRRLEQRLLPLPVLRAGLITVMITHAAWSLLRLVLAAVVIAGWHSHWRELDHLLDITSGHGWKALVGLGIAAVGQIVVVAGFGAGAVVWLRGREELGVRLGIWSDVVSLTVVNVLASYFSQFLTVFTALAEALLLWLLIRYRIRRARAVTEPEQAQPKKAAASS